MIMKIMKKQIDWFDVAYWTLIAFGLAINPLFWILVAIGFGCIFMIGYAALMCFGFAGTIAFVILSSAAVFFGRKYGLC